ASVVVALTALAADAPAGHEMKPLKKIDQPFVNGLVGEWTVTTAGEGPKGPMTGKGTAKFVLGVNGTAVVEDYTSDVMGGYSGHGVGKVSEDGKTLRFWWFDSMNPEPIALTGPLADASVELTGACPEGTMTITWKKVDGG